MYKAETENDKPESPATKETAASSEHTPSENTAAPSGDAAQAEESPTLPEEFIIVPHGGLTFVTPDGRPVARLSFTADRSDFDLYGPQVFVSLSLHTNEGGATVLVSSPIAGTTAFVAATALNGGIHVGHVGGLQAASVSSTPFGGIVTTYGPNGEVVGELRPDGTAALGGTSEPIKPILN